MSGCQVIQRFVFVKLEDSADRSAVAASARSAFAAIDVVKSFDVLTPADEGAEVWDLCFRVEFETLRDVPTYVDHPAHRAFVDEVLTPRAAVKKAWNFQA